MAITVKRLRKLQIGQEVTEATEVAATAVFLPTAANFTPDHTVIRPQFDTGLLTQRNAGEVVTKLFRFEITTDASFEQILYPLNNVLKAVTTGVGVADEKTYTFNPSPTGADSPKPFTMEQRYTDGTNNIDRTYVGCAGTDLEITGALGALTAVRWSGFAQQENTNALTAALTAPVSLDMPVGNDWALYCDFTAYADLGDTARLDQLQGFTWRFNNGRAPKWYMDGDRDVSRIRRGERSATLSLNLDQEASAGLVGLLRAAQESRALAYIRLEALSLDLIDTLPSRITIDGAYTVETVGGVDENDGEDSVTIELMSIYDPTAAQDIEVEVVTTAATLT